MSHFHVEILLATFNGARYLQDQLDSLGAQTYSNWSLIVRDDGSTDSTRDILKTYSQSFPGRVRIIEDSDKGLGAKGNFARLLEYASAPYVMFCDQDDIWLPNKIELLLHRMLEAEAHWGSGVPLLIHSDLEVVNHDLSVIANSFWKYQYLEPTSGQGLNTLLVQNTVTGCATIINRALYRMALPIPQEAIMHDWWLALVGSAFGRVELVPQPTVRYRQHDSNSIGAKRWGWGTMFSKAKKVRGIIEKTQRQARAFTERFGMSTPKIISEYGRLQELDPLSRRSWLLRNKVRCSGWLRNLGFWLYV
ncbi:MAG: glycosyl transferase [Meiothermus sp.]|nr:MAG: glycosyl transferase [Meiothermus sp.]